MNAWRLSRCDSQQRTFDGEGARVFPGRWNPSGVPVAYASEHLSLAVLELLVHARVDQVRIAFHAFDLGALRHRATGAELRAEPAPSRILAYRDLPTGAVQVRRAAAEDVGPAAQMMWVVSRRTSRTHRPYSEVDAEAERDVRNRAMGLQQANAREDAKMIAADLAAQPRQVVGEARSDREPR
jgi:RES domain-containing protein